ncbi:hypothetical protein PTKIN_Ptkin01aG0104000 [Pterospermum kingtungense]
MIKTPVGERFSEFFDKWVSQLDDYLQQLHRVSKESLSEAEKQALLSKLTAHYKEFYTVKWTAAHEDVLAFYSPVWLSKLENAYSWFTGWKPSIIFRLVESMRKIRVPGPGLAELKEEQLKEIEQLRMKIKLEEEKVEREMERQQVAMADQKIVELVRMARRIKNGELVGQVDGLVEVALKGILGGLERVMKAADCVRLKTLKGVLDVLNPSQSVDFLAGICMLQIQLRQWGQRRDSRKDSILELQNNVLF